MLVKITPLNAAWKRKGTVYTKSKPPRVNFDLIKMMSGKNLAAAYDSLKVSARHSMIVLCAILLASRICADRDAFMSCSCLLR
jgi:hypothetical protein